MFRVLPWLAVCALLIAATPGQAAKKGKVTVEKVAYGGWKNNLRIKNAAAELLVTLDVGPRIISYKLTGGKNVLKEYTAQLGKTGEKDWQIRGGHRLWTAPEDLTRTYALDNGPVTYKEMPGGVVRIIGADDKTYGIRKEIDITLSPDGTGVKLEHRITNIGDKATTLAPWALTVMAPGGMEIIPLPAKKPHPGAPSNARSPADYAPNQKMILWPFFDYKDARWTFGTQFITLKQDAKKGPTKIGLAHTMGWVGYLNEGTLFVKRFVYEAGDKVKYPDGGCNFETFTNEDMLEVETLGPVTSLAKGKTVKHTETWELFGKVKAIKSEADIAKNIVPLLKRKGD